MNITPFLKDLQRAFRLVWGADKNLAKINSVLQITQALLPIVALYFMKLMIEAVTKSSKSFEHVLPLIIIYGALQLLIVAVGQYSSFIIGQHQHKLTDNLSKQVLDKAINVDYEYYENPAYHDTMHLAQQQAISKATQLLNNFNTLLLNSLSLVFLLGFFFTLHSLFALLFICLSLPLAAIKWYSGHALLRLEKKFVSHEREANYLHHKLTSINSAKEVRVFGYGEYFIQKFKAIRILIFKEKTKLNAKLTWYNLAAEGAEVIVMVIIFAIFARYTWLNIITIGTFVIYIQGFQKLQGSSKNFLQAVVQIFQQRLFLKDLFAFLDLKVEKTITRKESFPVLSEGLIIKDLSFTYPGTEKAVLHNISINCKPGKIIALVGENGSGKSTLVKLIARLYEQPTNEIKIDQMPINEIDNFDFRKNTVFLFQDFEKYFLTISENISLDAFNKKNEYQKIVKAATLADAHSFIMRLGKGYNTRVGRLFNGSEQLSGGQWQKLALSRVFYKSAQLIVLDEPTSALDPIAEFQLFENIKTHFKNQMVVLITHRLYNLKLADHIYVLKDGKIDQEGSFETLITKEGEFKKMFDHQKL